VSKDNRSTDRSPAAGGGPAAVDLPAGLETASFGRRAAAFVVDAVLCALVAGLFTYPNPPGGWSTLVFLIAYSAFIGVFAESPGMRLFGLRCEGVADRRPIGLFRAALRSALIVVLIPALLIGPDGRRWHDRIVGSIVLRRSPQPA
jgi:uncharacterized RDD family membrane protein YckC